MEVNFESALVDPESDEPHHKIKNTGNQHASDIEIHEVNQKRLREKLTVFSLSR